MKWLQPQLLMPKRVTEGVTWKKYDDASIVPMFNSKGGVLWIMNSSSVPSTLPSFWHIFALSHLFIGPKTLRHLVYENYNLHTITHKNRPNVNENTIGWQFEGFWILGNTPGPAHHIHWTIYTKLQIHLHYAVW